MTESFILLSITCVGTIVVAAAVTLVIILIKNEYSKTASVGTRNTNSGWTRWLPYLGIALLLAFWSFWISVFFLFVVWIMQKNPPSNATYEVGTNEKNTAKRVYNWLFWSSLITVPMFSGIMDGLSYRASTNERVFIALLPLIIHTPLLLGLTSKSAFVYRHTQQGILLMAIRATTAAIAASTDSWWIFIFGNGALWLFGTIWGRNQVILGECWWMSRKGEQVVVSSKEPDSKLVLSKVEASSKLSPEINIERSKLFSKQNQKGAAIEHALEAFRAGSPEIKKQAIQVLASLGEVEQF